MSNDIKSKIKGYIMNEFLPGEDPDELTDSTPLISGGVLDSIATIKLVDFMEQTFGIRLEAHETDPEHLDTLDLITQLVQSKQ